MSLICRLQSHDTRGDRYLVGKLLFYVLAISILRKKGHTNKKKTKKTGTQVTKMVITSNFHRRSHSSGTLCISSFFFLRGGGSPNTMVRRCETPIRVSNDVYFVPEVGWGGFFQAAWHGMVGHPGRRLSQTWVVQRWPVLGIEKEYTASRRRCWQFLQFIVRVLAQRPDSPNNAGK